MSDYFRRGWLVLWLLIIPLFAVIHATVAYTQAEVQTKPVPAPKAIEARVMAVAATPTPTPTPTPQPTIQAHTAAVEPTPTPVTWRDNPQHCDLARQLISLTPPFNCVDKEASAPKNAPPASNGSLIGNWDSLLQANFGGNWQRAKRIMMCESSGNAHAIGPTDSGGYNPIGLFQIKNFAGRPSTAALMDGATNIAYAAKMSGAGANWSAWECAYKVP